MGAAVSNGRGLNRQQWPSPRDPIALANEHISIAHVIREAVGAQVDRQTFALEKWTAAVPTFDRPIGLLIMVA
jgi:hypothetical protein